MNRCLMDIIGKWKFCIWGNIVKFIERIIILRNNIELLGGGGWWVCIY